MVPALQRLRDEPGGGNPVHVEAVDLVVEDAIEVEGEVAHVRRLQVRLEQTVVQDNLRCWRARQRAGHVVVALHLDLLVEDGP